MNTTEFINELRERFPEVSDQSLLWYCLENAIIAENAYSFLANLAAAGEAAGDEAETMT